MNRNRERSVNKMIDSICWSRRRQNPFRKHRNNAVREFLGDRYSDDGSPHPVFINTLQQVVSIYLRQLAAKPPAAMVSTKYTELKPTAMELKLATNHMIEKINLHRTLRECVQEALFAPFAIAKLGLTKVDSETIAHMGGQYFVDPVPLDDWVHDMTVQRWDQLGYMGNRYRMVLEHAKAFKGFHPRLRSKLEAHEKTYTNEGGDSRDEAFAIGEGYDREEPRDFVELWEIFDPIEQLVYTFEGNPGRGGGGLGTIAHQQPLAEWEWTGPRNGPYHKLEFMPVPGNTMGQSLVGNLQPLHELINNIARKLADQAKRQKSFFTYTGEDEDDVNRVIDARDGFAIRVENQQSVVAQSTGGIDQLSLAYMLQMRDVFSAMAGNLDTLGGLSPQADTLGQERLLSESASKVVDDMQDQVVLFSKGIITDIGEYLFYDKNIRLPLTRRVPNTKYSFTMTWPVEAGVDLRDGDFVQYNFSVAPYSTAHETPSSKLNTINQFFQQFVLPNMPMLQQQGIGINFERLFKVIAELSNMDALEEILLFTGEPQGPPDNPIQPAAQMRMPNTTRTNVRINRPGATNQGKSQIMQAAMLGGNPQQSERAAIGRPTG